MGGGIVEQKVLVSESLVFLDLFKDGGHRVGPIFHLLVFDVYQRNEEAG